MAKLESNCNQQRLVHTETIRTLQQEHMRRNVAASALMEQYRSEAATRFAEVSRNQDRALVSALEKHSRRAREQEHDAARAYADLKRDAQARLLSAQQAHALRCSELESALAKTEATLKRQAEALQSQSWQREAAEQATQRGRMELQRATESAAADREAFEEALSLIHI